VAFDSSAFTVGMPVGMKFRINIGDDHIDIKSFDHFRNFLNVSPCNNFSLKHHILPLLVLQVVVYKFTLQCKVLPLIKTFCIDSSDKIR
jgi:hypothetical protein